VLQALCELAGQGATADDLEHAADAFLASPDIVELVGSGDRPEARYSTVELLQTEQRAISTALRLLGANRGVASDESLQAALAARPYLSDEQREMVQRLTRDGDGVAIVLGVAGAGKTTALAAAREAWQDTGLPVQGCALARKAAHVLRQTAGIEATSVAALLRRPGPLDQTGRPPASPVGLASMPPGGHQPSRFAPGCECPVQRRTSRSRRS
jgi:hypothetical protein